MLVFRRTLFLPYQLIEAMSLDLALAGFIGINAMTDSWVLTVDFDREWDIFSSQDKM